ncbi:MAG: cation diffusion facilitator family transporter [Prevotellaceae bacterium]|jgi:cobalt-zinc-cadmium efflux system protein|nr:cation diffusion facilitator family transporter [Prevotellaceae bacterium]
MIGHRHNHENAHNLEKKHAHVHGNSNIGIAFFLNLAFSLIEIVGGYYTNSVAILSDALHDLGDSFSLALAWYFQKLSKKKRDSEYSYGYRRFSLLGALINSAVLLIGSLFVITESVNRLISPEKADAKGMFLLAIFGILINGAAMLKLRKSHSLNERTVSLHLLEDVLGWFAVLVASAVMLFVEIPILDPILSLGIACYILFNIYNNLRDTLKVILQGVPENINAGEIEKALLKVEGIESVHDLHLWTMDGEYNISSVHIVVGTNSDCSGIIEIKNQVKQLMKQFNVQHSTVEIEQGEENCEYNCDCC